MPPKSFAFADTQQIIIRRGEKPIIGELKPYFSHSMMAGQFGPNPYHPPVDKVKLKSRFLGTQTRKVISEPVPDEFQNLPQYQSGTWRFVEGYRPS